jgi:tight adherence protein B
MRLAVELGGAPARALDAVSASLRDRLGVAAEARALAAQAKASAAVMFGAPLVFCVFLVLSDSSAAAFLLRTPLGLGCLVVGVGLDAIGARWMGGILRRVTL